MKQQVYCFIPQLHSFYMTISIVFSYLLAGSITQEVLWNRTVIPVKDAVTSLYLIHYAEF